MLGQLYRSLPETFRASGISWIQPCWWTPGNVLPLLVSLSHVYLDLPSPSPLLSVELFPLLPVPCFPLSSLFWWSSSLAASWERMCKREISRGMSENVFLHPHTGWIEYISWELFSFRISKGLLRCLLTPVLLSSSKPFWFLILCMDLNTFDSLCPHCSELSQSTVGSSPSVQLHIHCLSHVLHLLGGFHDDFLSWGFFCCFVLKICVELPGLVLQSFFCLFYFPFLSLSPFPHSLLPSLNYSFPEIVWEAPYYMVHLTLSSVVLTLHLLLLHLLVLF